MLKKLWVKHITLWPFQYSTGLLVYLCTCVLPYIIVHTLTSKGTGKFRVWIKIIFHTIYREIVSSVPVASPNKAKTKKCPKCNNSVFKLKRHMQVCFKNEEERNLELNFTSPVTQRKLLRIIKAFVDNADFFPTEN